MNVQQFEGFVDDDGYLYKVDKENTTIMVAGFGPTMIEAWYFLVNDAIGKDDLWAVSKSGHKEKVSNENGLTRLGKSLLMELMPSKVRDAISLLVDTKLSAEK